MLPSPQTRWRAVPDDALACRDWDGEVVVFNQQTGSTHLLGEFAGEVLRHLVASEGGATAEALAAGLSDGPSGADAAGWTGIVAEVLSDFARLGLAQPDKS
jgi:PqqD family protein of HPr-rel-A system